MTRTNIKSWIQYWINARMVAFDEIKSLADMAEARKWCSCLRLGVMWNVRDEQMWTALQEMRG